MRLTYRLARMWLPTATICALVIFSNRRADASDERVSLEARSAPSPQDEQTITVGSSASSSRHVNIFALSLAYQAPLSLEKNLPLGGGVFYTREYFVSDRMALGIHVGGRIFPTDPWHVAIGYGLTIKHYVGNWGNAGPGSGLYLLYGLLLQMNFLEGHSGSDTGHDTRLSIGYDWRTPHVFPFVELGYHITQLRNFDEDTLWWPYVEIAWGLRF